MNQCKRLKIGIVGCGAIGSSLAKEIVTSLCKDACLVALYDIKPQKAQALSRKLTRGIKLCVGNLNALIKCSDLVIEASSARASWEIASRALSSGRKVMVMSVGGMVGHLDQLYELTRKHSAMVYFCTSVPCACSASYAPWVKPGYMVQAWLALLSIS